MFSIKESVKYGWTKFNENMQISILATLLMLAVSLVADDNKDFDGLLLGLLAAIFSIIIKIGYTKVFLRIYDGEKPRFSQIFDEYRMFWKYLGVSLLVFLAVLGGLILFIIPGILWAVRFSFAPIITVDLKSGPIVAMKESSAITKGKFWKILLFWLAICGINILGFLALALGLLVSIPVSSLAAIYVYRELSKGRVAVSPSPAPLPMASST